ncbi:hypothetical protein IW261DRAFT_1425151 [Armillaria novae-zelandiae]|uniref:Uncharacterized protein n=1 Tax=Armillaria novae-zelandiae TaxID=153914 RepID=A0AA39NTX6_9AGAR|nr:hypothetical protein IW261DRAFT_1425151 [Armillaria novae-zelandiae]
MGGVLDSNKFVTETLGDVNDDHGKVAVSVWLGIGDSLEDVILESPKVVCSDVEKEDISGGPGVGDSGDVWLKKIWGPTPLPDVNVITSPFPEPDNKHESLCHSDEYSVLIRVAVKGLRDFSVELLPLPPRVLTNPRSEDNLSSGTIVYEVNAAQEAELTCKGKTSLHVHINETEATGVFHSQIAVVGIIKYLSSLRVPPNPEVPAASNNGPAQNLPVQVSMFKKRP